MAKHDYPYVTIMTNNVLLIVKFSYRNNNNFISSISTFNIDMKKKMKKSFITGEASDAKKV